MSLPELRKLVTYDEDTITDGGRACTPPLRMIAVAAVITNPWYGRGYVEDLQPEIRRMGPALGKLLTDRLIRLAGSGGLQIHQPNLASQHHSNPSAMVVAQDSASPDASHSSQAAA